MTVMSMFALHVQHLYHVDHRICIMLITAQLRALPCPILTSQCMLFLVWADDRESTYRLR